MEQQPNPRPSRSRFSSPGAVVALGIGLLALLGLVAAASRAHHTPGARAGIHQPPTGVGDYVFSIAAVLLVGMALFLLYLWFSERDLLVQRRQQQRGSLRVFFLLVLFAVVAGLASRYHFRLGWRHGQPPANINLGSRSRALKEAANRRQPRPPEFKWLPVFIATGAGITLLGVIGARSLRRARLGLDVAQQLEEEFTELVEDTLADLYAEQDPRRAIIKAYARVERLFGSYGLPRDPAEAPMEYLGRVLGELRASGSALRRLTALFEWAKFSAHDVDSAMRDEAISALVAVRDELNANRVEDEVRKASAATAAR